MLVLAYHAVSAGWPWRYAVTPAMLEDHISYLAARGYRGATFADAVARPHRKTVAITFDDGFASVAELARPLLERHGFVATVFVVTDYVGGLLGWPPLAEWLEGPYEPELASSSWDELRSLRDAGWEIASHTRSHPALTTLDDETLAAELRGSREACERELGVPCGSLAYPFGDYDERVVAAARAAGYTAAGTFPPRFPRPRPLEWPRTGITLDDRGGAFRLKVSPLVRRVRSSPAAPLFRRAVSAARSRST